jgi:pyrroline-5-carboxylate reductase
MLKGKKIGCLGVGNMGRALVQGLLRSEVVLPEDVKIFDRDPKKMAETIDNTDSYAPNAKSLIQWSDIVLLAIKPQDMGSVLLDTREVFRPDQLIISIAAGQTTADIESVLDQRVPVVRVMPNLPVVVGVGASAYCLGNFASWPHGVVTSLIFSSVGMVVEVVEEQMDTVTALSGSGPAYVFLLAEMLTEAGTREGLPREVAGYLVTQTLLGGAKMLDKSRLEPAVLREQVTSPNGTTAAAIKVFQDEALLDVMCKGIHAARVRSEELSRGSSN